MVFIAHLTRSSAQLGMDSDTEFVEDYRVQLSL
jgi:hypothetical protein